MKEMRHGGAGGNQPHSKWTSGPTLQHIVPNKKSFGDDHDEDDVMKEMRLCTRWISIPPLPKD